VRRVVEVAEVVRVAGGPAVRELFTVRAGRASWRAPLGDTLAGRLAAANDGSGAPPAAAPPGDTLAGRLAAANEAGGAPAAAAPPAASPLADDSTRTAVAAATSFLPPSVPR
jgi:pilus assembly protein CpaF